MQTHVINIPENTESCVVLGINKLASVWEEWLHKPSSFSLFLVDDDEELLEKASHSSLALHPSVRILKITPLFFAQQLAQKTVGQKLFVWAEPRFQDLLQNIYRQSYTAEALLTETADFGIPDYKQSFKTWKQLKRARSLVPLKNSLANTPAIVCGAGPSLKEDLPWLPTLAQQGLLLSAGNALAILDRENISPHFHVALDANTPPLSSPILAHAVSSLLPHKTLASYQGECFLLPNTQALPWKRFFLGEAFDFAQDELGLGWTAGTAALRMALWFGCNPIILVGMDFCYGHEQQKYADAKASSTQKLIQCKNYQNETVWTQKDWSLAATWTQSLIQSAPQVEWIHTSSRSLIPLPVHSLQMLSKKLPLLPSLPSSLHSLFRTSPFVPLIDKTKELSWKSSLLQSQALLQAWMSGNVDTSLTLHTLSLEPIYIHYLAPLWAIWEPFFQRETAGQNLIWHQLLFFQEVIRDLSFYTIRKK